VINIGVLASGRGSNFQAILDARDRGLFEARVVLLIVDNPDAYALTRAARHGVESLCIDPREFASGDAFYGRIARELTGRNVDLVLLAGFMRVVGKPLLEAFPLRVMNIHPALLPSFPGLHGQAQALEYGVKVSGCTVHFVDEGVDTGPIIIQAAVPVLDGDTEESLSERILAQEHRIYPEAVRLFAEGRLEVAGRKVFARGSASPAGTLTNPPEGF
jgi:phosphoribosylglycinamide formyltransferase-1